MALIGSYINLHSSSKLSQPIFGYHNISCFNSRNAVRFSNPGRQTVMWWAWSAPLVGIGLTKLSNSDLVDLVTSLDLFGLYRLAGLVYLPVISWLVDYKIWLGIYKIWKNFVIQKSMTRKPFLEFSHMEAKSLDIFLCAVACLLSKASWIEFEKFTRTLPIIWWQNDINSARKFFWAFILWFVFSKQSIWHADAGIAKQTFPLFRINRTQNFFWGAQRQIPIPPIRKSLIQLQILGFFSCRG